MLLHGFPYDVHSYVDMIPRLVAAGLRVVVPYLRGHRTDLFPRLGDQRSRQQAAIGVDGIARMDALAIPRAIARGTTGRRGGVRGRADCGLTVPPVSSR